MIRGKRAELNVYDDYAIIECPACGNELFLSQDGYLKCKNCEYEYQVIEVKSPEPPNSVCMICGSSLLGGEFQFCSKCKEIIKNNAIKDVIKND